MCPEGVSGQWSVVSGHRSISQSVVAVTNINKSVESVVCSSRQSVVSTKVVSGQR